MLAGVLVIEAAVAYQPAKAAGVDKALHGTTGHSPRFSRQSQNEARPAAADPLPRSRTANFPEQYGWHGPVLSDPFISV